MSNSLQKRIDKLLRLAEGNPNPHEAEAARTKAQLLMRRMNAQTTRKRSTLFGGGGQSSGWSDKPIKD